MLATIEKFLTWWIELADQNSEQQARLIDFLHLINEHILTEEVDNENSIIARKELIRSLAKGHYLLLTLNSPQVLKTLDDLIVKASEQIRGRRVIL